MQMPVARDAAAGAGISSASPAQSVNRPPASWSMGTMAPISHRFSSGSTPQHRRDQCIEGARCSSRSSLECDGRRCRGRCRPPDTRVRGSSRRMSCIPSNRRVTSYRRLEYGSVVRRLLDTAAASHGPCSFANDREFHEPSQRLLLVFDADECSKERDAMDKRDGAVDRIDHPAVVGCAPGLFSCRIPRR